MSSTNKRNLIKLLQTGLPRGAPINTNVLKSIGISSFLARKYVDSGWLVRLGRGVFMFPNDTLDRDKCLVYLSQDLPHLHVSGKTALAWRGYRHNIAHQETICLLGSVPYRLPSWFTQRFPATYRNVHLFSQTFPEGTGLQALPEIPNGPLVSVPERAVLELLNEVGSRQGVEEAQNILESVTSLRPIVMEELLSNCTRVKVRLIYATWAEALGLPLSDKIRNLLVHGTKRWSSRLPNGSTLTLTPP
jgi:hypothetical protein